MHRIQRIPANDPRGRRHSSTATVAVLPGDRVHLEVDIDDVRVDRYRGHGKGGQARNKTSSAVRLTHLPSGEVVVVERGRSQYQNLEQAREELARRLGAGVGEAREKARNELRGAQIRTGERSSKQWTWNDQRGEVLCHESGERWRIRDFLRGKFDPPTRV